MRRIAWLQLLGRWLVVSVLGSVYANQVLAIDPASLRGIVVDDTDAKLTGTWQKSTSARPFIADGYIHDGNADKGERWVRFELNVPADGEYHVLVSYSHGTNRARKVPVTIESLAGETTVHIDQSKPAKWADGFEPLGTFKFEKAKPAVVTISNANTKNHVIVDAVRLIKPTEFELAKKEAGTQPKVAAKKPTKPKPPVVKPPEFTRVAPKRKVARITSAQLDQLLQAEVPQFATADLASDEEFLRRVSLDLIGRPPTLAEYEQFMDDPADDKRSALIDRLLELPEYGNNWANYWSDSIAARQQEPQLTFHDYGPLKRWLAEELNDGTGWDEIVFRMVTAIGKVSDNPASTFIGFHQGDAHRLAGETTRMFLSQKIHCAECHDHPFVDMPQETFHGMAAFFVRTEAKVPQLNSDGIEVLGKTKGEQKISGKKEEIAPTNLAGESVKLGTSDLDRRIELGKWLVSGDNPDFARAYVNRVWARLLGRGFAEPVDDFGEMATIELPEVLEAISSDFVASEYDHRALFRAIMNSKAYQRSLTSSGGKLPFASAETTPLRGDEVFDSLVVAVKLENVTPPREKKTGAVRFPPPPKSTRDLINDAFGYDPSFDSAFILRTMKQAMFMMNNQQLNETISADSDETFLAELLKSESDDRAAITRLYRRVLARNPSEKELKILLAHRDKASDRTEAFEDILWSLVNSAEFTVRK